jgi:ABC-type multidrug transport system fused ATPase/permease subunit
MGRTWGVRTQAKLKAGRGRGQGVTFRVEPREKVGIVGRTGSGKSSLIVALFRMVEPFQGQIVLDGLNLLSLGLQDVRGRIAAIPQVRPSPPHPGRSKNRARCAELK